MGLWIVSNYSRPCVKQTATSTTTKFCRLSRNLAGFIKLNCAIHHLINIEMPINKFGISLGRNGEKPFRIFVCDNALCVVTTNFDIKSRKIRHIALLIDDGNAVNKRYRACKF